MTNENFEELIQAYREKVQQQYSPFVAESSILACRDYYVFQTEYKYQPELMIVVLNPGGNGTGHGGWLAQGKNSYIEGNHLPC